MGDYMCNRCGGGFDRNEILTMDEDTDICLYCHADYGRVQKLLKDGNISNLYCDKSKVLILPNEGMYVLAGMIYSEAVDIDFLIEEVSEGEYKTKEEAYADNESWFYWTTNYDEDTILKMILEDNEYVDKFGIVHEL